MLNPNRMKFVGDTITIVSLDEEEKIIRAIKRKRHTPISVWIVDGVFHFTEHYHIYSLCKQLGKEVNVKLIEAPK
jgi:hypothetical protein